MAQQWWQSDIGGRFAPGVPLPQAMAQRYIQENPAQARNPWMYFRAHPEIDQRQWLKENLPQTLEMIDTKLGLRPPPGEVGKPTPTGLPESALPYATTIPDPEYPDIPDLQHTLVVDKGYRLLIDGDHIGNINPKTGEMLPYTPIEDVLADLYKGQAGMMPEEERAKLTPIEKGTEDILEKYRSMHPARSAFEMIRQTPLELTIEEKRAFAAATPRLDPKIITGEMPIPEAGIKFGETSIGGQVYLATLYPSGEVKTPSASPLTKEKVIGQFNLETGEWRDFGKEAIEAMPTVARVHGAGWGNVFLGLSGVFSRVGDEQAAADAMRNAQELRAIRPDIGETKYADPRALSETEFWYGLLEALPFMEALMPSMLAGAGAGTGLASMLHLPALQSTITVSMTAGGTSAVAEGMMEAGMARVEALDRGFPLEAANEAFDEVLFMNIGTLTATNSLEFALAFMGASVPGGKLGGLFLKAMAGGLSEGGEEILQEIYVRQALGDEIAWDKNMAMQAMAGFVMGGAFVSAGNMVQIIHDKAAPQFSPKLRQAYDIAKQGYLTQGDTEQVANTKALGEIAKTEEGSKIIGDVVNELKKQEVKVAKRTKATPIPITEFDSALSYLFGEAQVEIAPENLQTALKETQWYTKVREEVATQETDKAMYEVFKAWKKGDRNNAYNRFYNQMRKNPALGSTILDSIGGAGIVARTGIPMASTSVFRGTPVTKGVEAAVYGKAPFGHWTTSQEVAQEYASGESEILLAELPKDWHMEIGETRTKEGITAKAEIDWRRKVIVFQDKESIANPEIVNHEIAHVIIEGLSDKLKGKLLDDYVKAANISEQEVKNQFHREAIAINYGEYLTDATKLKPEIRTLFDKNLPKAVHTEAPTGGVHSAVANINNPYVIRDDVADKYLEGVIKRAETKARKARLDPRKTNIMQAEAIRDALIKKGHDALVVIQADKSLEILPYKKEVFAGEPTTTMPMSQEVAVAELAVRIRKAPKVEEVQAVKRSLMRKKAAAMLKKALATTTDITKGEAAAGVLKGLQLPVDKAFEPLKISPELDTTLRRMIDSYAPWRKRVFDRYNAISALNQIFRGELPTMYYIGLLEDVFGLNLAKALLSRLDNVDKAIYIARDIMNISRSTLASVDFSVLGRQLAMGAVQNPRAFWEAVKIQLPALLSEKRLNLLMESLRSDPDWEFITGEAMGVDIMDITKASAEISQRPEFYASRFAERIPFVRMSERAYVAGANIFRWTVAKQWLEQTRNDSSINELDHREMGKLINWQSGRGSIAERLQPAVPMMNSVLFALRLQASRIQMAFGGALIKSPVVRRIWAKTMVKFLGTISVIAMLAAQSGLGDVELDPRSTDFGRIKIGNTRLDLTAGLQPYFRLLVRGITGQTKTATGKLQEISRLEEASRQLRAKFHPFMSFVVDTLLGETYLGEEMVVSETNVLKQAYNRLTPLFIQDMVDAIVEGGMAGGLAALPALIGVGAITYPSAFEEYQKYIPELPKDMLMPYQTAAIEVGVELVYTDLNALQRRWIRDHAETKRQEELAVMSPQARLAFETVTVDPDRVGAMDVFRAESEIIDEAYQSYFLDMSPFVEKVLTGKMSIADYKKKNDMFYEKHLGAALWTTTEKYVEKIDPLRFTNMEKWHEESLTPEDRAYEGYKELRADVPLMPNGSENWDLWARRLEEYLAGETTATNEYISQRRRAFINNLPPLMQPVHTLIMDLEAHPSLDVYYDTPEGQERLDLRDQNPELDAILTIVRGLKARSEEAVEIAEGLGKQHGITLKIDTARQLIPKAAMPTPEIPTNLMDVLGQ